jgi:DNA-binding transcriptional MerR regulator
MVTTKGLTIAEAAERTGLTPDTLRYYESDGLMLRPVGRSSSGHRRYTEDDLRWIELLTRLRGTGMPIRDVRRYAALVRRGDGNEQERLDLLMAHRRVVLAQLAEVQAHLGAIDAKIGIYEDKLLSRGLDLERARSA